MASNIIPSRKGPRCTCLSSKAVVLQLADAASWCCAFVLVFLVLLTMFTQASLDDDVGVSLRGNSQTQTQTQSQQLLYSRGCDEIYVVGEGETLHTISHKCGDPYIVENNPHIHDPDDVFPGLVLKITPST